jgi:hypothetical protein
MDKQFDELSKSLAEDGLSRRQALRKFGLSLAGVLLTAVGLSRRANAGDCINRCHQTCHKQCGNDSKQNACFQACYNTCVANSCTF